MVTTEDVSPATRADLVLRALRRAFLAALRPTAADLAASVPGLCLKLGALSEPSHGSGPLAEPMLDNAVWYTGALRGRALPAGADMEPLEAAAELAHELCPAAPTAWGWGPRFAGYGGGASVRWQLPRACAFARGVHARPHRLRALRLLMGVTSLRSLSHVPQRLRSLCRQQQQQQQQQQPHQQPRPWCRRRRPPPLKGVSTSTSRIQTMKARRRSTRSPSVSRRARWCQMKRSRWCVRTRV